ncbi:MAG: methylated-DNA--[protein]-cysteine S-methyltransferase [Actinomycetota bacterium]|nr:methylated-DNA--[protein]-cysteine S-methyltransferase [Actinomycetota bacterium]
MMDLEKGLRRGRAGRRTGVPEAVIADFETRAVGERLIDVAYATVDSPLGRLLAASTKKGLIRLSYENEPLDAALEHLAVTVSPRIVESPKRLDAVRRELDEYFEGRRTAFDIAIDWSFAAGFVQRVLKATARIPFGSVRSYAQVAEKAGSPRGSRAAGNALGSNPVPIVVPCHRVLRSGGAIGGYTGGLHRKEFLLHLEGVQPPPNPRKRL